MHTLGEPRARLPVEALEYWESIVMEATGCGVILQTKDRWYVELFARQLSEFRSKHAELESSDEKDLALSDLQGLAGYSGLDEAAVSRLFSHAGVVTEIAKPN